MKAKQYVEIQKDLMNGINEAISKHGYIASVSKFSLQTSNYDHNEAIDMRIELIKGDVEIEGEDNE